MLLYHIYQETVTIFIWQKQLIKKNNNIIIYYMEKNKKQKRYTEKEYYCANCGKDETMFINGSYSNNCEEIDHFETYTLLECSSCHKPNILQSIIDLDKDIYDLDFDPKTGDELYIPIEKIIYPTPHSELPAVNEDLTDEIKKDYKEAANIFDLSPRGACALLRLIIQKICVLVGEKGKKIDDDIGSLVQKHKIDTDTQQAMDSVRVIGNMAVHPGEMNPEDDIETAKKLFILVNDISDDLISKPKRAKEIFNKLPETKKNAINNRDSKGQSMQKK